MSTDDRSEREIWQDKVDEMLARGKGTMTPEDRELLMSKPPLNEQELEEIYEEASDLIDELAAGGMERILDA